MLSLLFLPLFANACTQSPPTPPPTWWVSTCPIDKSFSAMGAALEQCNTPIDNSNKANISIFVGVEVILFLPNSPEVCLCGAKISQSQQQLFMNGGYVTWSCKKPEMHQGIVDANNKPFLLNTANPIAANLQGSINSALGVSSNAQSVSSPSSLQFTSQPPQPSTPCPSGWVTKLWVKITNRREVQARRLGADIDPVYYGGQRKLLQTALGTFSLNLVAGSDNADHPPKPIDPANIVVGGAGGDVHFMTLDGAKYTFNAAGDYVYVRTVKSKFELHVRQVMTDYGSVLAAIGIRDMDNNDIIEVWWDGDASNTVKLNARHDENGIKAKNNVDINLSETRDSEKMFGKFVISKSPYTKSLDIKHREWGNKFNIHVKYFGKASFRLELPKEWETEGLGGNQNGEKNDDLCFRSKNRDGCLSMDAKSSQVHEFGLSWKVNPHELIFQRWMSVKHEEIAFKKLTVTTKQLEEASQFCLGDKSCAYDLISTGDREFAHHTLKESIAHSHKNITYVGDDLVI